MADQNETNKSSDKHNNTEDEEEWSDQMCINIAMEDNFPATVKDPAIHKHIINRFINFYLSGNVQKGLSARDIIFAVIAIMPDSLHSEELTWKDIHYSDEGHLFFLSPEGRLKTEIDSIMKRNRKLKDIKMEQQVDNVQNNMPELPDDEITNEVNSEANADVDASAKSEQNNEGTGAEESTSKENVGSENITSDGVSDKTLIWFRTKRLIGKSTEVKSSEYGPVENSAFCTSCNKILDNWETDIPARIRLKLFFGLTALCLMRLMVKSYNHAMNMFTSTFPKTFAGLTANCIRYSPPSNACLKKSLKILRKKERQTQIMFAKIVVNSFYLHAKYLKSFNDGVGLYSYGIINTFKYTVLAHTSNYGMEIINLLQEVACGTDDFYEIFELLKAKETEDSWNRVNSFFKRYMCKSSHQATCHWARAIDSKRFKYLSCENSYGLAVVIAVFVEKLSGNDGIWNGRWVKSGTDLELYKQLGIEMYQKYRDVQNSRFSQFITSLLDKQNN